MAKELRIKREYLKRDTSKMIVIFLKRIENYEKRMDAILDRSEPHFYTGSKSPFYTAMEERNEQVNLCLRLIRKECGIEIPYVRPHQHNVEDEVLALKQIARAVAAYFADSSVKVAK